MKKVSLSIFVILSILIVGFNSCSKTETCNWSNSTLSGKTFVCTKVVRSLDKVDVTNIFRTSTPCAFVKQTFNSNGTYSAANTISCATSGTWATRTSGNINYYDDNSYGSEGTYKVLSYDCNSFSIEIYFGTELYQVTFTKQ